MSLKDIKDNNLLLPRCLVMVFSKEIEHSKATGDSEGFSFGGDGKNDENILLFEDFIEENKGCFWDPHLEESLSHINIAGIIFPNSVLISGRDIHLDTIRRAWAKRVLRSPLHYTLLTVGEVSTVLIESIPQAQFTSLPDALCMITADLNKSGLVATFDAILESLKLTHEGVHQPPEEVIYEALGTLIKERKLYHTGKGYHVITPDLFAHLNHLNGCVTLHGKKSAILMPYQTLPSSEMCSIACQTEEKDNDNNEDDDVFDKEHKRGPFKRSYSFRDSKKTKEKKQEKLTRSQSMRFSEDKAATLLKELNSKSNVPKKSKEKGEKRSVFTKIFGSKTKKNKQPIYSNVSELEEVQEMSLNSEKKTEAVLATFSAQFPPPDMQVYSDQLLMMQPPQIYHLSQMSSDSPYGSVPKQKPGMVDADTQSEMESLVLTNRMKRSQTLPSKTSKLDAFEQKSKTIPTNSMRDFMEARQNRLRHSRRSSSHSPGSNRSYRVYSPTHNNPPQSRGTNRQNSESSTCTTPSPRHANGNSPHPLFSRPDSASRKSYSHYDEDIQTRQAALRPNSVGIRSSHFNSSINSGEDIYESIHERSTHEHSPRDPKPFAGESSLSGSSHYGYHGSVESGMFRHPFSPPFNQRKSWLQQTSTPNDNVKNSSQKNKIYRKYREFCNTPTQELESNERHKSSRRSKRRIKHAQSCDSGVNAVGLAGNNAKSPVNSRQMENIPKSELDLRNDYAAENQKLAYPKPLKHGREYKRDRQSSVRNSLNEIHEHHVAVNGIDDSGFTSPKSANNTYMSRSTSSVSAQNHNHHQGNKSKAHKSNHNTSQSKQRVYTPKMNGHISPSIENQEANNSGTRSLSYRLKDNNRARMKFFETNFDETQENGIEATGAKYHQKVSYRPSSNHY